jgi:inorganic pyrophosphatase
VETFTGRRIAVIHRRDDVETKWVLAPEGMTFTAGEIMAAVHFQEQYFDSWCELMEEER